MEVNFSDFTNSIEIHNFLLANSKKKIIKMESRLLDEVGVVVEHSDTFLEGCGDIKYYFDDDESLEINRINSLVLFVRANGDKLIVDDVESDKFEKSFIELINGELGLNLQLRENKFDYRISGKLSGDKHQEFKGKLYELCEKFHLEIQS